MTKPFVRPDVAALLAMIDAAERPPMQSLNPSEARAGSKAARAAMEVDLGELAVVRDFAIPGPVGTIGARLGCIEGLHRRPSGGVDHGEQRGDIGPDEWLGHCPVWQIAEAAPSAASE